MGSYLSELVQRTDIERRARSIADPVQRLRYIRQATAARRADSSRCRLIWLAVAAAVLPLHSDVRRPSEAPLRRIAVQGARTAIPVPSVWPVEQTPEYDLYSNGLRIENRLTVAN